jgi:hypothetical protein
MTTEPLVQVFRRIERLGQRAEASETVADILRGQVTRQKREIETAKSEISQLIQHLAAGQRKPEG